LLLSRTTERRQEFALRAALGASRARLVQQMIAEATALTMAGAALGLLIARWTSHIASAVAPAQLATQQYTILDWRVLGFAGGLALVLGIVFGAVPAWLIARPQPWVHIVRRHFGTHDLATRRVRAGLIALQAALTLTLVAGSLGMGRTFLRLLDVNLGFRTEKVVTLSVSLEGSKYQTSGAQWQYYTDVLDRLRAMPEIEAAAAVRYLPLAKNLYMANSFKLDSGQEVRAVVVNSATPDYFRVMGTKFLAGRDFVAGEPNKAGLGVIVDETFAQRSGLGATIVGRRLTTPWSHKPYGIVGVVATTRYGGPADPGGPKIYWPVEEEPPGALTFVAKTRGQADRYIVACRDAVRAVSPDIPVYDVKTLEMRLTDTLARPRFYTTAILFFGGLALLLAVIGIYGSASHSVAQRTHEMGVRMALGASRAGVRAMVMRENLTPIFFGMTAGIAGAIASGQYLEHLIVGAEPLGFATCMTATAFLLVTAAVATWSATAGILRIDPVEALRAE
jgi:putative ABC transport system permease protein